MRNRPLNHLDLSLQRGVSRKEVRRMHSHSGGEPHPSPSSQLELRLHDRLRAGERAGTATGHWESIRLLFSLKRIPGLCSHTTPITHTAAQHASRAPPPTRREATTPYTHPSTAVCLLAMSTRLCCHRQRNYACTAHRPDDTRDTTDFPLPSHPTAFLQAS